MSLYTIVLFVHVLGAIAYIFGAGARLLALASLRRAHRVEQVRIVSTIDNLLGPIFGIGLLLLLAAGLYLTITIWGFQTGWIDVALASVVLMAPFSAALLEPRRRAIGKLARELPDGAIPEALSMRIYDPVLRTAVQTLLVLLLGIVFLMTVKPSLTGSIITMIVALLLGLASALLPVGRRGRAERPRQQPVAHSTPA